MNILKEFINYFAEFIKNSNLLSKKQSARQAKERLQIVVSHQRATNKSPEFISKLRQELIAVISKYVEIDSNNINVNLQQEGNNSILELNITIPDSKDSDSVINNKKKVCCNKVHKCKSKITETT